MSLLSLLLSPTMSFLWFVLHGYMVVASTTILSPIFAHSLHIRLKLFTKKSNAFQDDGQTDIRTDGHPDRRTDRQTDRQTWRNPRGYPIKNFFDGGLIRTTAHCRRGLMCLILKFIFTKVVAKKIHDWAIFSLLTLSSFAQFFAKAFEIYGHYKPWLKFSLCKILRKSIHIYPY